MFINWDGFKRMTQLQGWTSATSYFDLIGIDIQIDIWLRFSGLRNNQKITSRYIPISMPTTWVPDTNFSGSDSPAGHGFKGLSTESIWRFLDVGTSNHLNVSIFHGKIRYDKDSDAISSIFTFMVIQPTPQKWFPTLTPQQQMLNQRLWAIVGESIGFLRGRGCLERELDS